MGQLMIASCDVLVKHVSFIGPFSGKCQYIEPKCYININLLVLVGLYKHISVKCQCTYLFV